MLKTYIKQVKNIY